MAKRHKDALATIYPGACNPSGIAHSILDACQEIRQDPKADTETLTSDPAIRLMIHQLAYICGVDSTDTGQQVYLENQCRRLQGE